LFKDVWHGLVFFRLNFLNPDVSQDECVWNFFIANRLSC